MSHKKKGFLKYISAILVSIFTAVIIYNLSSYINSNSEVELAYLEGIEPVNLEPTLQNERQDESTLEDSSLESIIHKLHIIRRPTGAIEDFRFYGLLSDDTNDEASSDYDSGDSSASISKASIAYFVVSEPNSNDKLISTMETQIISLDNSNSIYHLELYENEMPKGQYSIGISNIKSTKNLEDIISILSSHDIQHVTLKVIEN